MLHLRCANVPKCLTSTTGRRCVTSMLLPPSAVTRGQETHIGVYFFIHYIFYCLNEIFSNAVSKFSLLVIVRNTWLCFYQDKRKF